MDTAVPSLQKAVHLACPRYIADGRGFNRAANGRHEIDIIS
jgi:hypothetical protein